MTARMQKDLDALTRVVDDDRSVGAVVLTGGIPGRYIPHFDISAILAAAEHGRQLSPSASANLLRGVDAVAAVPGGERALERSPVSGLLNITRFNELVLRIMRSPAVYIAAIGGACGGGGLEMSACFDVRLAAEDNDAVGFILPELLIGLTTTVGGQRLAQLIGPGRALEMMLEGRMYSPQEAAQMGLVNRLVPPEDLIDQAKELGARYARRNRDTIAAQKKIFNENLLLSPAESLRREGAANASAVMSGPAPQALQRWVDMQRAGDGDSVFLTDREPWIRGEGLDLNAAAGA